MAHHVLIDGSVNASIANMEAVFVVFLYRFDCSE